CQESVSRHRESLASPIVCPAPVHRDRAGWTTRRLGEGRRTAGTRHSAPVRGSQHQEARHEEPQECAREAAGRATAQVVPEHGVLQLSGIEGTWSLTAGRIRARHAGLVSAADTTRYNVDCLHHDANARLAAIGRLMTFA